MYVHLPFCPYICPYCDFAKWPHKASAAAAYLQALHEEIASLQTTPARTIFLGGGTPNTYDARDLARLLAAIMEKFPSSNAPEISIEVNPELVVARDLERYAAMGISRVSIGVQSFQENEIATLGRRHSPADVARVVSYARAAGLRSVSLDLMFAVPGQTPESWRASVRAAIDLGVDHVSTYGLTIEEGTPFKAWEQREPAAFFDDTREAGFYADAIDLLEAAGFEQYEISNFAKPGQQCLHNVNYWENGEYVGLGVGAASYRDGVRSVHTRRLDEYLAAIAGGDAIPSESERLEGARRAGEAVMLALRTAQGVCLGQFKERYGLDFLEFYGSIVTRFIEDGVLESDARNVRLTRRGRFLANTVCEAFVTRP